MKKAKIQNCAFVKNGACCALISTKSCGEKCAFFKMPFELAQGNTHSDALLRRLEPYEQSAIAEKYYNGYMPWQENGDT